MEQGELHQDDMKNIPFQGADGSLVVDRLVLSVPRR